MTAPPDASLRFEPAAGVVSRQVGEETVLVDLDGELYFSLNSTGTVAWEVLATGDSVAAAVDAVVARFDVSAEVALADLGELVDQLVEAGLLESR